MMERLRSAKHTNIIFSAEDKNKQQLFMKLELKAHFCQKL